MKNSPHPIQYQGSKRSLASTILRYAPKEIERFIEPFAGSAALSIAAAARQLAKSYLINDLNKPLTELLCLIVENPIEIASFYEELWKQQHKNSVEHYYRVREDFNRTQDPRLFLYLLARCVKGAVRYNADGLFNQSPDKRRKGTQPTTMRANIIGVSSLLKDKSIFSSFDYREILNQASIGDLVYMDPPYQGVCGDRDSRYLSKISYDDFVIALEKLNRDRISYIVSYDGRRGDTTFGELLPDSLELTRIELEAGRSSQATLLGRDEITYESLYISKALVVRLSSEFAGQRCLSEHQGLLESGAHHV
ncbi:MAG TPA: DNA adenine methylase [Candidatus Competibacteraceae bacterium]|nr:DNA adenine methylase [Candidatus Competibacteraceae bacterium]HRC70671.1 Dam family site-specific DNA-(adenine-N6)-methyltransferase [Candidatus Competibacter denitrificans]